MSNFNLQWRDTDSQCFPSFLLARKHSPNDDFEATLCLLFKCKIIYQQNRAQPVPEWNTSLPFCGLMIKDCVAPFTSRQYPSIKSAIFSAMVKDGAVTVRG